MMFFAFYDAIFNMKNENSGNIDENSGIASDEMHFDEFMEKCLTLFQ